MVMIFNWKATLICFVVAIGGFMAFHEPTEK
jgi:hypothetical protein